MGGGGWGRFIENDIESLRMTDTVSHGPLISLEGTLVKVRLQSTKPCEDGQATLAQNVHGIGNRQIQVCALADFHNTEYPAPEY